MALSEDVGALQDAASAVVARGGSEPGAKEGLYAGYVLFLLIMVNLMNSIDRSIVNILVEPIRREFHFSDTQIGAIAGLGFALFYGLLGLPIARLADRSSRKRLLAAGIVVWSAMTILTGRAVGFWSMLGARFGVGAGEATCYPTALSLIGDYFKPTQRPRAIGLFQIGLHGGFIVGAAVAGLMAERYGWRSAFSVLGLPGLVLAGLLLLTVREPVRGRFDGEGGPQRRPAAGGWAAMAELLGSDRIFVLLVGASTFMSIGAATLANWGAAYLMRSHGLSESQVGVTIGPILGLGGFLGTVLGGVVGTAVARRMPGRAHAPLLVMLYTALPSLPFMALFVLAPTMPFVILGGLLGGVLTSIHYGPLVAVAITRVAPHERGLASSVLVLGQTVIGFGLGPLIAGGLSDALSGALGRSSLRYAMLIAPVAVGVGWGLAFLAWRSLQKGVVPPKGPLPGPRS